MTTRIYDESVLLEEADFKLLFNLEGIYDVKNADGTAANAVLAIKGTSKGFALSILGQLAENDAEDILEGLAQHCLVTDNLDFDDEENEEAMLAFQTAFDKERLPFIEFGFGVKGDYKGEESEAEYTLTAPSYAIAYKTFVALSSKKRLSALVASFMPEDNEDWDY